MPKMRKRSKQQGPPILTEGNYYACESQNIQITRMIGHFALTLLSFYLSIIIAKIADRAQVLTSFNCLRNQGLHFIYDAM